MTHRAEDLPKGASGRVGAPRQTGSMQVAIMHVPERIGNPFQSLREAASGAAERGRGEFGAIACAADPFAQSVNGAR